MEQEGLLRQIAEKQIAEWEEAITELKAERGQVQEHLQQIERRLQAMVRIKENLEATRDWDGRSPQPSHAKPRSSEPKGSMTVRQAMIEVLQEAQGKPLHSRLILGRVRAKGAVIEADDPIGVIDLAGYNIRDRNLASVEKVGPRTWRYVLSPTENHLLGEAADVSESEEGVDGHV